MGQNFVGQGVTEAISLGQEVSGAEGSGAGSRESGSGIQDPDLKPNLEQGQVKWVILNQMQTLELVSLVNSTLY